MTEYHDHDQDPDPTTEFLNNLMGGAPADPQPPNQAGDVVAEQPPGRRLALTRASEIVPEPVVWAWLDNGEGRIPGGAMTIAAGREGTGKSSFGFWMTAKVTRGTLPGSWQGRPRAVFYVAIEDSWKRTIVPRLIAADADLSMVYRVEAVDAEFGETTLSLPHDNLLLEQAIIEYQVALVVFDPLMSCIGRGIDTHREREVRTALDPLARMADRTESVALGIAHFNKGSGTDAASLITGSGAFKNVPRAVFGFARDEDQGCSVMTQAKNSLGRSDLPSLRYTIESAEVPTRTGVANAGRFVFLGESDRTVEDVLAAGTDIGHGERGEAAEWLRGYLLDKGGQAPANEVKQAALADDIAERTLKRAMAKAGVESVRQGFGKGSMWRLKTPEVSTERDGFSSFGPQLGHSGQPQDPGPNGPNGGPNGSDPSRPSLSVSGGTLPLCSVCGEPMRAIFEPGQTTHPMCDPTPSEEGKQR